MRPTTSSSGLRLAARAAALAGCVFAVTVCGEQGKFPTTPTGGGGGGGGGGAGVTVQLPTKTPTEPIAAADSVFVQVHVSDSRGVKSLLFTGSSVRGSVNLGTDTTVQRYLPRTVTLPNTKDTVITRYLRAVLTDSTPENVTVAAFAINTANDTTHDTSVVRIVNGPRVSVLQPTAGAVTALNKYVRIQIRGIHPTGVKMLGWRAVGAVTASDSFTYSVVPPGVLPDTQTFTDSVQVTAATPDSLIITPFATDSAGDPSGIAPGVTVKVVTAAADTTAPLVQDTVPARVEVGDSITVTATDPSGVKIVGFLVRDTAGNTVSTRADTLSGTSTNVTQRFRLALDTISTFPRRVTATGFAVDAATAGNKGGSSITGASNKWPKAALDTLTVVAGNTIALPQGGAIGDAIVDSVHGAGADPLLLLTNTALDQVEVFHLKLGTFGAAIRVGSQPVGIALWPKDTLGNYYDSVIVANSGGTNLSLVNVRGGAELRRRAVPNWSLATIKTQTNSGGGIDTVVTSYELADRPQYLGATCRRGGVTACDSVIVVYSTTPTGAQPSPFVNRGYVAWENITAPIGSHGAGHLFYEQADRGTTQDTLEIVAVRDTVPGVPIRDIEVGPAAGIIKAISQIAFQDSTFVRNSGNFVHALMGEGGLNQGFARALMYDATKGVATVTGTATVCTTPPVPLGCLAQVDAGVSDALYVSDFLTNHASPVLSVATNFNGRTNLIRADSIYAFDWTLKQTGLMQLGTGVSGLDFDPRNAFDAATKGSGAAGYNNSRLVYAADPATGIDVFDTYWYQKVATIPIRDTIIGPIRVAISGTTVYLAGVTSHGVVLVKVPSYVNQFPVRQPLLGGPASSVAAPARPGGRP